MSLLTGMAQACKLLEHTQADDAYGGTIDTWADGDSFNAVIIKDSSTEAVIAEKQGASEIFTVVTESGFGLSYHDVFRRVSDGLIFRVTSNAKDSSAPDASTVQIEKVTAERWELPNA